jgi:hypothetical protein
VQTHLKWTALDPCLVFSESDIKLYTNFEFCEGKNHIHFKNTPIYKAKQTMTTTKNSKKNLHILEDGTSGVQVGDTEQMIVSNLFKV